MICALVAGTALIEMRHVGFAPWNTIWAEDGAIYLRDAVSLGFVKSILAPHAGYLQVVPHLIAEMVALFPLRFSALMFSLLGSLGAASLGVMTYFVLNDQLAWKWLRLGVAVGIVALPPAEFEISATAVNFNWYLLSACSTLILFRPRKRASAIMSAALLFLTALSTPLVALYFPLIIVRMWRDKSILPTIVEGGLIAGLVLQGIEVLMLRLQNGVHTGLVLTLELYLGRIVTELFFGWNLSPRLLSLTTGAVAFLALAAVGGVTVLALIVVDNRGNVLVGVAYGATSVALFAAEIFIRGGIALRPGQSWWSFPAGFESRYSDAPLFILLIGVFVLLGVVWERPNAYTRSVVIVTVLVVAAGWITSFYYDSPRTGGVAWSSALEKAALHCRIGTPVAVPINPPGWSFDTTCRVLSSRY